MSRSLVIRNMFLRLAILTPLVAVSYWLAWALRYDFAIPEQSLQWFWRTLPAVLAIKLIAILALQGWHEWMRYVSFRDLVVLASTLGTATVGVFLCEWFVLSRFSDGMGIPFSVVLLDFLLSLMLIGGTCSLWRFRREHLHPLLNMLLHRGEYRPALSWWAPIAAAWCSPTRSSSIPPCAIT